METFYQEKYQFFLRIQENLYKEDKRRSIEIEEGIF
jgi:hypothetical protein